jgi:hypothetical protein
MSGVAGADRVKSRQDFQQFLKSYKDLVSKFPGFVSMNPSGSYNSNLEKNDFGDIDLIVHIQSDKDKAAVKKELQAFFHAQPETVIVPFSSAKHAGKRSYNAGELVSVRYHDDQLGYSAQIDNIVALDQSEASFKQSFLDWPAEVQGLVLGLVKIATIETDPQILFKKLGIQIKEPLEDNQEYEFNLSGSELQLRKVTYEPGTFKQIDRQVLWSSKNFDDLQKLLYQYNLKANFDDLLQQCKKNIRNPRSGERMKGVFASMITVKSGEIGTAKGAGKEAALAKIQQTFSESKSLFRSLMENPNAGTVVFAFGRFQPPTIGHELLINAVKQKAEQLGCPYYIYVSRTVGTTPATKLKNPLNIDQKMGYLQKLFPGTNFVAAGDTTRTPIEVAKALNEKFQNLVMVAGSDRVPDFEKLLTQQNGTDYNFQSIKVVSGGERDPDADDASGMSGTKMRQAAAADDLETFKSGLPNTANDALAQQLMNDVKVAMTPTPKVKKAKEEFMPRSNFAGTEAPWNYKLGSDAQLKGNMKRPAKAGDLVGGGAEESIREGLEDKKKSWDDYGMPTNSEPKEKHYHSWDEYEQEKNKEKELDEANSLEGTIRTIVTNGEPIAQLYERLKAMAKKWVDNNGSLKGYHRNAGGIANQWFHNFYFNKLQAELFALTKQAPRYAPPLIAFLKDASEDRERSITFKEMSQTLPHILAQIGSKVGNKELQRFGTNWEDRREEYERYLAKVEAEAEIDDDDYEEPKTKTPKNTAMGQQAARAEEIVNDLLKTLPSKVAGEIRNAIARAPNKLVALKKELEKRKIAMENNDIEPGEPVKKRGIGFQNYVSRTQAPMGPMESKHVPVSENIENIMDVLINKIIVNEAIQNNK